MAMSRHAPGWAGGKLRRAATAAAVVLIFPVLDGCQPKPFPPSNGPVRLAFAGSACPRPQPQPGAADFNGQEQEIRTLRRLAFHGDLCPA